MNEKFEALHTASEYMIRLKTGVKEATEHFQQGQEGKGSQLVPLIADGIQWISEIVTLTRDVHKEEISLDIMNGKLAEIVEAFENEDYILIGDLFEYELYPLLEEIEIKINKCIAN